MKKENRLVLSCFLYNSDKTTEIAKIAKLEKIDETKSFNNAIPKEEDFIYVPFRLISSHIVGQDSWQATDFGNEEILKKSIPLLEGKPAYINHDTYNVQNTIGTIVNLRWVEKNGEIPAGIEGDYRIDAVSNLKIARAVLNGEIQGSSVTISFIWTPSHEFEEDYMFEWRCGETINGEMVRRIVTEITDYYESSLVFRPADKYARPITVDKSKDSIKRFKDETTEIQQNYTDKKMFSFFDNSIKMKYSETEIETDAFLTLKQNYEKIEKSYKQQKEINIAQQEAMQKAENEITKLSNEIKILNNQIQQSMPMIEFGKKYEERYRNETKRVYQLSVAKPLDSFLKLIEMADFEQLEGIAETYGVQMIDKFSPKCQKCGNENISFQSAENVKTNEEKTNEAKNLFEAFNS